MKTSLWKTLKSFMGDDIALTMDFYRWQSNQYSDSPQATYRIDLMALQAIVQHNRSLRTLCLEARHMNLAALKKFGFDPLIQSCCLGI